jgi:hypothetical protein
MTRTAMKPMGMTEVAAAEPKSCVVWVLRLE